MIWIRSNPKYAPYLPTEERETVPTDQYVHFLDKKYSLDPLILALKSTQKPNNTSDLSNALASKINVSH